MDFTVARTFSSLYIVLDIVWLLVLAALLLYLKRRMAVVVGLLAGALYFLVDYGIFFQFLGTREIEGANPLWFLLWLSVSYGFTNFAWIWLRSRWSRCGMVAAADSGLGDRWAVESELWVWVSGDFHLARHRGLSRSHGVDSLFGLSCGCRPEADWEGNRRYTLDDGHRDWCPVCLGGLAAYQWDPARPVATYPDQFPD